MSQKFTQPAVTISEQFTQKKYVNTPTLVTDSVPKDTKKSQLWYILAQYREAKEPLAQLHEQVEIQLNLLTSSVLRVTATENQQRLASYEIPVTKRGKYLILKKKFNLMPIPFLFFYVIQDKAILTTLENGAIGYARFLDEKLRVTLYKTRKMEEFSYEFSALK